MELRWRPPTGWCEKTVRVRRSALAPEQSSLKCRPSPYSFLTFTHWRAYLLAGWSLEHSLCLLHLQNPQACTLGTEIEMITCVMLLTPSSLEDGWWVWCVSHSFQAETFCGEFGNSILEAAQYLLYDFLCFYLSAPKCRTTQNPPCCQELGGFMEICHMDQNDLTLLSSCTLKVWCSRRMAQALSKPWVPPLLTGIFFFFFFLPALCCL